MCQTSSPPYLDFFEYVNLQMLKNIHIHALIIGSCVEIWGENCILSILDEGYNWIRSECAGQKADRFPQDPNVLVSSGSSWMRPRMKSWRRKNCWRTCSPTTLRTVSATPSPHGRGALRSSGPKCFWLAFKVDELMAALKKKDEDMRAMEERYKMYLEKARNVSPFWVFSCPRRTEEVEGFWIRSILFLPGDPSSGPQTEPCHHWDPGSEEPAGWQRQADPQPGGNSAPMLLFYFSLEGAVETTTIFNRLIALLFEHNKLLDY